MHYRGADDGISVQMHMDDVKLYPTERHAREILAASFWMATAQHTTEWEAVVREFCRDLAKGQPDTEPAEAGTNAQQQPAEPTAVTTDQAQMLSDMTASSDTSDDDEDDGEKGDESAGLKGRDALQLINAINGAAIVDEEVEEEQEQEEFT